MKAFKKQNLTPHAWPVRTGQVAITLQNPRGYCVEVLSIRVNEAVVRYLDSQESEFSQPLFSLIPTGKTPEDLIALYTPTPQSLDLALDIERSIPDFTKLKKKGGGKGKVKKAKKAKKGELTEVQKEQLKVLLLQRWKELQQKGV